ncbi:hypothetical protein BDA96_04G045700 [Sorghum bicolor]|uniref:C2H2-type domain-containing protein n=2 Tax=Sorghum bicolor TaxID=4558 RepID=A0A921R250_SORBI|nr:serrate RNA effector molecule isoform X2 [Sorghum bicolor]KAG0531710.1 hypothetical protein BDA96_04G045700 [Sorghum bicolor]KXG29469.1 hypothetical protein SORBI_3004G040800 [Sorghum bicolor]|eukprot:XP_021314497.1 serrate RNA effector molecule isoform X2 [Sorghum bicolor]
MEHALCSPAAAPGASLTTAAPPKDLALLPPPPPPPLGSLRPQRLEGFVARPAERTRRTRVGSPGAGGDRGHQRRSMPPLHLPHPPPLGSSRPELDDVVRLQRDRDRDRDAPRRGNARRSGSSSGAGGDRRQRRSTTRRSLSPPLPVPPPPPPLLGSTRPELAALVRRENDHDAPRRGSARRSGSPGAVADRRPRRSTTRRSPSPLLPLPPPPTPPLGSSSRPEVAAVVRVDSDHDARRGGSRKRGNGSPRKGAEGGRRRERGSPPPRSPSPAPRKRSRRGSPRNECGRNEGRGNHACSRFCSPDRPYSGYGAATIGQDTTGRLGLMTYKQFIQVLEDDVSPAQAGCRYQEYRTEYISTQKRAYFDLNKNEDWLKDMYHPTKLLSVIRRRNDFCKTVARNLILDLRNGTLDLGPGVTAHAAIKSGKGNDGRSQDNADYGEKKRKHGRGPQKEIEPLSAAPKAHPISSQHRRIHTDIHRTLALVKKLDSEKGIMENILLTGDHGKSNVDKSCGRSKTPVAIIRGFNTVKGLEGVELLDTLLTYLWRVHGVDYYGMSEMKHAKGFRHVRAENKSDSMAEYISAADWEKKLDSFWEERLMNGEDPLVVLTAMDKIEAALVEVLERYVRKMRDENCIWKYFCGAKGCEKLFHAPEYVHKHLNLKHPDLVSTLASRVENDIYFQNYMNDPDAPGGKPFMQQTDRMRQRLDEQMFDASGVWGSHAPLLPMCAHSLVLIPVPGAGPYGPFVPAPPEIAMQMIQKGLAGPDSAQNRKPSVLGPMLPMYPSFPLGSGIYRSYEDLDAPMEEVSPLDFRSL